MIITVSKEFAQAAGEKALEKYGVSAHGWAHRDEREIDLANLGRKDLWALGQLLEKHRTCRSVSKNLANLESWKAALADPGQKAKNAQHLCALLKLTFKKAPAKRVYENDGGHWWAYYVDSLEYYKEERRRDYSTPAHVDIRLVYEELGGKHKETKTIYNEDARGKTPVGALAELGLHLETTTFRQDYLKQTEKFHLLQPRIGLQLQVTGVGHDNLDGNREGRSDSCYWSRVNTYEIGTLESPGRAVVDIFREVKSSRDNESQVYISNFWERDVDEDDEEEEGDTDDPTDAKERELPEIPLHPNMAVFDLKKHLRLRVHVDDVEEYKYDTKLVDKLVLRKELKDLVHLLVEHKEGTFLDIVQGKSGGAVVLLAGPPGTGKTLTAEVYAESEQRALYSVQCSQLGVDPEELEEELLKIFSRAKRWNAVLLLDEADVYVHTRGQSLEQNAIVGVFLRVLEYQSAVLFLTTNRPDDVDDAVASRCIARLVYTVPEVDQQKKIWEVLADTAKANLASPDIDRIVVDNPGLTGRDVKNLLKLAMLTERNGQPITAETIRFVKQFKPTGPIRQPMAPRTP